MSIAEAIVNRHSVRDYTDQKIEGDVLDKLQSEIEWCNQKSGLNIQLVTDEPEAFSGMMAHYGKFRNAHNYVALIGQKSSTLDEAIGYYGQHIALIAQELGLNTCWVALTFRKRKTRCAINAGEKLVCVLSIGYGRTQGVPHKSKPLAQLTSVAQGNMPVWFAKGMEAAQLAPTATNQQKFLIGLKDGAVSIEATGGFYSNVDLGIVKYHFEVGAGTENFTWC